MRNSLWHHHTERVGVAVTLLPHIQEALDLNLDRDIDYHHRDILWFSLIPKANARIVPPLGHDRFLQNPFSLPVILPFGAIEFSYYWQRREITHKENTIMFCVWRKPILLTIYWQGIVNILCFEFKVDISTWRDNFQIENAFINRNTASTVVILKAV
jgi:hypothetical protein